MGPRFILVDAELEGSGGHNATYAGAALAAAEQLGYRPHLVTSRSAGVPGAVGRYSLGVVRASARENVIAGGVAWNPGRSNGLKARLEQVFALGRLVRTIATGGFRRAARTLEADLTALLGHDADCSEDVLFFPSAGAVEIRAARNLMAKAAFAGRIVLLLRRDPDYEPEEPAFLLRLRRQRLRRTAKGLAERVTLFSDTDALARRYSELTAQTVRTAPIPVAPAEPDRVSEPVAVYLGDARAEKGFSLLPKIARLSPDWRIRVQSNDNGAPDPTIASAKAALAKLANIELRPGPFSPETYQACLVRASVVLLPYAQASYRRRSSGVFAEALAAGVPPLVSQGSWMAAVIQPLEQEWLARNCLSGAAGGRRVARLELQGPVAAEMVALSLRGGQGEIRHAAPTLYFVLPEGEAGSELRVTDERGRPQCYSLELMWLPTDAPSSAVGVICAPNPEAFAAGLEELQRFGPHYSRTAAEHAVSWRTRHSPSALVHAITTWRPDETPVEGL